MPIEGGRLTLETRRQAIERTQLARINASRELLVARARLLERLGEEGCCQLANKRTSLPSVKQLVFLCAAQAARICCQLWCKHGPEAGWGQVAELPRSEQRLDGTTPLSADQLGQTGLARLRDRENGLPSKRQAEDAAKDGHADQQRRRDTRIRHRSVADPQKHVDGSERLIGDGRHSRKR